MTSAYVLLNTEIGAENQVLKALKKIEGIEEAHNLWGVYDIIANIKADNMEKLKNIINRRISKISKINSKLTIIITEEPEETLEEQLFFEQDPMGTPLVQ
ncbi:MAG TPA: Lrp/AsnC ligand binding domain-containing protein [Candidatus Limnocylindrales bacterium]|nr:Lrp/AsnC ligand binding domain-containing protein [Candidatus Limnocylindrales bacterium]